MIFKKKLPPPPPCHFRQFVATKESWAAVLKRLEFRPKTNNLSLRKQSIDASTESAIKSSYLLLAAELFYIVAKNDSHLLVTSGEEPIVLECLAFASSFICNIINPESENYELYLDARQSTIESISLMSLLDNEDIENALLSRFDIYDKASDSTDREEYLSDTFARVLTYLRAGEHFSRIKIRYEDPANLGLRLTAQESISHIIPKLKEMIRLIVKRELDEEEEFEDDLEDTDEELDDIEIKANKYHEQIDAQIESSHEFLRNRFKETNINGQYSVKTLSVFTVHAATLLAVEREFPALHRTTLNGFTRTLSFRTPNTMPNITPPSGTFVSYCSAEESLMHKQTEVFEQHGIEPLVRNLLRNLGGTESDYKPLSDHIELAGRQASRTYLPFLAREA